MPMATPRGGSIAFDRVRVTAAYQAIVIGGLMGHMTCVKFFFESVGCVFCVWEELFCDFSALIQVRH